MGITKKQALRAIAAQAKKRARLPYDEGALLPDYEVKNYLNSKELIYKRFAEFYEALDAKRGGHPDYDFLAEPQNVGTTMEGKITTLFMDLKNFTKYCCFLSANDVYKAKYASIEATIGVCRIHGGHLHDITGDGVMFFFGGAECNDLDCARHALDAAADAMELLETEVISQYNNSTQYPNIHPKIGLDFGTALWGAYGAPPVFEVKATAFNVDIANKMMGKRHSQEVAIGDSLKEFLEVEEDEYLEPGWAYERQMTVNGQEKNISYKSWVFDWRKHLRDRSDDDKDLARIGVITAPMVITGSRTKLGDAPLA
jgi:class 3 adenylate cyclase